jgi:murein DD-endopeptidase MepM/ murein hydrolase activator NlpD
MGWRLGAALSALVAIAACSAGPAEDASGEGGEAGSSASGGDAGSAPWPHGGASGEAGSAAQGGSAGAGAGEPDGGELPDAAADAAEVDAAPVDPCAGEPNGTVCGGSIGAGAGTLVTCSAGQTEAQKTCANGCFNGTYGDQCKAPCCLKKPPGYIPPNGGWNACPYSGSGREHSAIDYTSDLNTEIPAGMDAVVHYIRFNDDPQCYNFSTGSCSASCLASGDFVVLRAVCGDPKKPDNDLFIRYHHINKVKKGLKVGDKVARGDLIAFVGKSGCATGAHIHLQTATFPKGKYKTGQLPSFGVCGSTVNPATRMCD